MKATVKRIGKFEHIASMREHRLVTDESTEIGGDDAGPSPLEVLAASLASCTATTMELYADRKGWDIGNISINVDFEPAKRGSPTRFSVKTELPPGLTDEQVQRLSEIAAKCPVHRALEGEVIFEESITSG